MHSTPTTTTPRVTIDAVPPHLGSDSFSYTVAPNEGGGFRTGFIVAGDQTLSVVSNLRAVRNAAGPAVYRNGGWRAGWSITALGANVLLYDNETGDSFQTIYTGSESPFFYWSGVRWPSGLQVAGGPDFGIRSNHSTCCRTLPVVSTT